MGLDKHDLYLYMNLTSHEHKWASRCDILFGSVQTLAPNLEIFMKIAKLSHVDVTIGKAAIQTFLNLRFGLFVSFILELKFALTILSSELS